MIHETVDDGFFPGIRLRQEQFAPIPVCGSMLAGEELLQQSEALDNWVTWLLDRYTLDHRTIPPCWPQHGALVEELSALRTAWITAYSADSTGDAPLHWHAEFAASRHRLADWVARTGCRPGEHRATELPTRDRHV